MTQTDYTSNLGKWHDLYCDAVPSKAYMSNNIKLGQYLQSNANRLKFDYVQLNTKWRCTAILIDVDHSDAAFRWEECNLPQPTFVVINPENGHALYIWILTVLVATRNKKSYEYFQDITKRIRITVGGDPYFYGKSAVKNPFSGRWKTVFCSRSYTLDELSESVAPLRAISLLKAEAGTGRNVELFEKLRKIAYLNVKQYNLDGEFYRFINNVADEINSGFVIPLPSKEVHTICKSVSRWTWKNKDRIGSSRYVPMNAESRLVLRQNIAKTVHKKRRDCTFSKIKMAIWSLLKSKSTVTQSKVSEISTVSLASIKRYWGQFKQFIAMHATRWEPFKRVANEMSLLVLNDFGPSGYTGRICEDGKNEMGILINSS